MKKSIVLIVSLLIILIQGCSHKEMLIVEKYPEKKLEKEIKKEEPKEIVQVLEIKNIEDVDQRMNVYLNERYGEDIKERLLQGTHYDLEYVNTQSKTYIFVKFKNSFLFCGSGGCSAKMLEYEDERFKEIESFTLIRSSIYLLHDSSTVGFSQIVVPVSYIDGTQYSTYYNIYEPFSENEHIGLYPKDRDYKRLQADLKSRKKSIKLFKEEEE